MTSDRFFIDKKKLESRYAYRDFFLSISIPTLLGLLLEGSQEERKLLLSENRGKYLRDVLTEVSDRIETRISSIVIVPDGPEGRWSSDFEAISLGSQVSRADIAALSSIALIAHFWNM